MSTPAATAFDLIRYAARIGGIGRAVETLRPLLPQLRQAGLRATLEAEDETATAQRLGYVFERLGSAKLAEIVDAWLPASRPQIPLALSAPVPPGRSVNSRWLIVDNTREFSEP